MELWDFKNSFLREYKNDFTAQYYSRIDLALERFCQFFGSCDISDITAFRIHDGFVNFLREKYMLNSISIYYTLLDIKKFIKYLSDRNVWTIEPAEIMSKEIYDEYSESIKERRKEILQPNQILSLKNYWINQTSGFASKRNSLLISIILELGLKTKEVSDININDIDFLNRKLSIKTTNNFRARTIDIPESLLADINDYLRFRQDNFPALFISKRRPKNNLTSRSIQRIFNATSDKVGIKLTPKSARETYATRELLGGAETSVLSKTLGLGDVHMQKFIKLRRCEEVEGFISVKMMANNSKSISRNLIRACNQINDKRYCKKIKDKWFIRKDLNLASLYRIHRNIPNNYITIAEAAKRLNSTKSFIRSRIKEQSINIIMSGNVKYINEDQLYLLKKINESNNFSKGIN